MFMATCCSGKPGWMSDEPKEDGIVVSIYIFPKMVERGRLFWICFSSVLRSVQLNLEGMRLLRKGQVHVVFKERDFAKAIGCELGKWAFSHPPTPSKLGYAQQVLQIAFLELKECNGYAKI